ncbi:hypothetical protein LshimejAT787_0705110 [Lyophyllum shimeji]|uniref:Uncharacterized protein n=1 Tax=Lyophyllum shimeji TaxID=47721 RepID=A0A9P3UR92_LYOSH|nr:hypothetical protein LshimejAT787_0705110 [Lyophyllum shimeji]
MYSLITVIVAGMLEDAFPGKGPIIAGFAHIMVPFLRCWQWRRNPEALEKLLIPIERPRALVFDPVFEFVIVGGEEVVDQVDGHESHTSNCFESPQHVRITGSRFSIPPGRPACPKQSRIKFNLEARFQLHRGSMVHIKLPILGFLASSTMITKTRHPHIARLRSQLPYGTVLHWLAYMDSLLPELQDPILDSRPFSQPEHRKPIAVGPKNSCDATMFYEDLYPRPFTCRHGGTPSNVAGINPSRCHVLLTFLKSKIIAWLWKVQQTGSGATLLSSLATLAPGDQWPIRQMRILTLCSS